MGAEQGPGLRLGHGQVTRPQLDHLTSLQNRRGSLSEASSETQAVGRACVAAQSLTRTVLPEPGPAATSVSGPRTPSLSRSFNLGRVTTWLGGSATATLLLGCGRTR